MRATLQLPIVLVSKVLYYKITFCTWIMQKWLNFSKSGPWRGKVQGLRMGESGWFQIHLAVLNSFHMFRPKHSHPFFSWGHGPDCFLCLWHFGQHLVYLWHFASDNSWGGASVACHKWHNQRQFVQTWRNVLYNSTTTSPIKVMVLTYKTPNGVLNPPVCSPSWPVSEREPSGRH